MYAQGDQKWGKHAVQPKENYTKMEYMIGPNFDLFYAHKGDRPNLLSTRPMVAPSMGVRATHLFSARWGAYAGLRMDFYEEKGTSAYDKGFISEFFESIFKELLGPLSLLHPTLDAGISYRMGSGRWSILPSIGLGYGFPISEKKSSRSRLDDDGERHDVRFRQKVSSMQASCGVSANYFVSKRSFVTMNTHFFQPLGKSYAELVHETNGTQVSRTVQETSTVGRNLNLSIGYGFVFGE